MHKAVKQSRERAVRARDCLRWLDRPVPDSSQVGLNLLGLLEESSKKRLRRRVVLDFFADAPDGFQETGALKESMKEQSEDGRPVLPAGEAEIRQERNRLAAPDAQQSVDGEGLRGRAIREKGLPQVGAVDPETVAIGAERARPVLIAKNDARILLVRIDSARNRAYSLHRLLASQKAAQTSATRPGRFRE